MGVVAADAAPNDMETSRSLEKLSLGGLKKITPAGIERLRKSCPKLTIDSK
jgi:hypothetical protein